MLTRTFHLSLLQLSGLKQDSNFHFFLEGIAPMWLVPSYSCWRHFSKRD